MKTLFKRSDQNGEYDFLAADSLFFHYEKVKMLVTHYLHQKGHSEIICDSCTINDIEFIVLSKSSDMDEDSSVNWVKLYLKKEVDLQISNYVSAIIKDKPSYLMVLKISENIFEIQAIDNLSCDDLKLIEQYYKSFWISICTVVFIFLYIIIWLETSK